MRTLNALIGVLVSLAASAAPAQLVSRYTFDNPVPGDPSREQDLGSDKTPVQLTNGAPRVDGGAFPGSGRALETKPIEGDTNNDHKAGVFFPDGSKGANPSTMKGTSHVTGITIMGWFKPTVDPHGTTSMTGILCGDEGVPKADPHLGRALFEIESIAGGTRIVALGRRHDADKRRKIRSNNTLEQDLPTGQWSHIAATFDFDTGSVILFRNGQPLPSTITEPGTWELTDGTDYTSTAPAGGIKIGGQIEGDTTPFTGLIDEIRVYNIALPATGTMSVQSIYREQASPPTTQPAKPASP